MDKETQSNARRPTETPGNGEERRQTERNDDRRCCQMFPKTQRQRPGRHQKFTVFLATRALVRARLARVLFLRRFAPLQERSSSTICGTRMSTSTFRAADSKLQRLCTNEQTTNHNHILVTEVTDVTRSRDMGQTHTDCRRKQVCACKEL